MNKQGTKRTANEEVAANAMGGAGIATYDPLLGASDSHPIARKELEDLKNARSAAEKARRERRVRAALRMFADSATRGKLSRDKLTGVGPEDIGDEI